MDVDGRFPQTLLEAVAYFADRDRALRFFVEMRWPNGIICPHCGVKDDVSFISTRRIWKCKACRQQFSAKVGTIFEDSPLGLDKWMACIWIVVNAKNAVSSYEIHRALGVRQPTAWFMLQRIRYALEAQNFEKFSGTVEADETFVGGKEKNKHKSKKLNAGRGAPPRLRLVVARRARVGTATLLARRDHSRQQRPSVAPGRSLACILGGAMLLNLDRARGQCRAEIVANGIPVGAECPRVGLFRGCRRIVFVERAANVHDASHPL